jgi:NAD(P)H-hydrate repair Nnr-like enzyme with NAD(P)H-hydrate dehydratase domain
MFAAALTRVPEAMVLGTSSANQLMGLLEKVSVLVVGPGLGQASWGKALLSAAANAAVAAGVGRRRVEPAWRVVSSHLPKDCVITPHPGEAARLLGISTAEVQADRPAAALQLSKKYSAVVVLKGAGSLIAHP